MDFFTSLLKNSLSISELSILQNTLFLLLILPFISTLVGIARHIVGIKSFNFISPIVLIYSFLQLGFINYDEGYNFIRGLIFGLVIFTFVVISSMISYYFVQRVRLHYIPKASIVITFVSFALCLLIIFYTIVFGKKGLVYSDIFTIVMIAILSESVISSFARKSFQNTMVVFFQTLMISIVGYGMVSTIIFKSFVTQQTIIYLVLIILLNFFLGRYVGLRLTEFWRFRSLIFSDTLSDYVQPNGNSKKKKTDSR